MHIFGILRILEIFDIDLIKFKNYRILLDKICHRLLVTTKLFSRWNIPIGLLEDIVGMLMLRVQTLIYLSKKSFEPASSLNSSSIITAKNSIFCVAFLYNIRMLCYKTL